MAGVLLVRNAAQRKELTGANDALFRSEWRFRSIFEQSPFSLWEQDYTELIALLDTVRSWGITDLAAHARKFPDFYGDLAGSIMTTRVNKATLDFLGATSESQVLGPLRPLLPADGSGFFKVIQALFEGKNSFEGRGTILDLDGRIRTILIGLTFPDEASGFRRVIVNIVDITLREQTRGTAHRRTVRTGACVAGRCRRSIVGFDRTRTQPAARRHADQRSNRSAVDTPQSAGPRRRDAGGGTGRA